MARPRLGVVLLLPEPVATEIDGLRRALGDPTLALIPPHVTLVPPINVASAAAAVDVVRSAAAAAPQPLELTIGPAATFSPLTPVLYLTVGGDVERLTSLRAAVLAGPLARRPEWPFVPHVTILPEGSEDRLEAGVAALVGFSASVACRSVHVLQQADDLTWRSVSEVALGPPAVIGRGGLPLELAVSADLDIQARRLADRSFAVTARREGSVVGVALGWVLGDVLRLERLVVSPAARHQGVGSHLVAAVEQVAVREGCERLLAFDDSASSVDFLLSHGWVATEASGATRELA